MNYFLCKLNSTIYHIRRNQWRFNLRKYFGDPDSIKIDRPIFLLGTQGGGLTLLSRILRRNHLVVSFTGNSKYWNGDDEMENALVSKLPKPLKGIRRSYNHPVFGTERHWVYAYDMLLPEVRKTEKDVNQFISERFKNIIRELLVLHSKNPNQARFIDKSQTFTVKVSFVNALLRDCDPFFILVVRNPYVMCYWATKTNPISKSKASYEEKLRIASQHWANSFRLALEDGEKEKNMLTIRFEDFLRQPKEILQQICDFVDLEYSPEMLPQPDDKLPFGTPQDSKWYPIRPNVNEVYLKMIKDKEISIIDERCGDLARKFGYK